MSAAAPEGSLRRLLRYARDFRTRIRLACVFSVLNKVFDLAPPLLIGGFLAGAAERLSHAKEFRRNDSLILAT